MLDIVHEPCDELSYLKVEGVETRGYDLRIAIEVGGVGPGRCARGKRTLVCRMKMESEAEELVVL